LKLDAPAKLNLFLEVLGENAGFHQIVTVMQTVSLFDSLQMDAAPDGRLELCVEGPFKVPVEDNLVLRAARLLWSFSNVRGGARINLVKRIPAGAGLGGGSSDAAAALMGLNKLWNLGFRAEQLAECSVQLGSDVPFFLKGGCSLCTGRGEKVEPLKPVELDVVLVVPKVHVSTALVYRGTRHDGAKVSQLPMLNALKHGDAADVAGALFNRLQETTVRMVPEVADALELLRAERLLGVAQSGSGGAVFGIAANGEDSRRVAEKLSRLGFQTWALKSPADRRQGTGEGNDGNH